MASVESYETDRGRRYRARWRDLDRRSKERGGFRTKREAELFLAKTEVDMASGQYVDPASSKATLGDLGREWLANRPHLKPSSLYSLEVAWRVHVEPEWGSRRIGTIRHSEVQSWVSRLSAGNAIDKRKSATVVKRAYGVLAGVLDNAVKDRRIAINPARGVTLPRKVRRARAYLTPEQVERLAREAGTDVGRAKEYRADYERLVRVLAVTGLRWGEAIGLRARSVDLKRRRIRVEENAVQVGGVIEVGTPKSHEPRSVPVPSYLVEALRGALAGRKPEELIFGNGTVHLFRPHSESGWFSNAIARCQAVDPTFPTLTIHDLRHTAASIAVSSGANVKTVQRMLGHASAVMTLDTYADLFDDDLDAAAERISDYIELKLGVNLGASVGDLWGLGAELAPETQRGPENRASHSCARGDLNPHALSGTSTSS